MNLPRLFIAVPVLNEPDEMVGFLKTVSTQTFRNFRLFVCVNQPDEWWTIPTKRSICESNALTWEMLTSVTDVDMVCIDRFSPGNGWKGKAQGVGWARKVLMDRILEEADDLDVILSLDADTSFNPGYFESVALNLVQHPSAVALSVPYFHYRTGLESLDRAMLRYEIYMRTYAINLWMIDNPYSFTALGSAIALPVWACRAIGGITPKLSGEDFYFLQKLVKYGTILHWNPEMVFPATRLSDRVYFGTGPALIKGVAGDWKSYPVYSPELFGNIRLTMDCFNRLFSEDVETPLDEFLETRMGGKPWSLLRKNSRTAAQFVRACYEKIDGLRILQYLKEQNEKTGIPDEQSALALVELIRQEHDREIEETYIQRLNFECSPVDVLEYLRQLLFEVEMIYRKRQWNGA
jgi:hypothetical protein